MKPFSLSYDDFTEFSALLQDMTRKLNQGISIRNFAQKQILGSLSYPEIFSKNQMPLSKENRFSKTFHCLFSIWILDQPVCRQTGILQVNRAITCLPYLYFLSSLTKTYSTFLLIYIMSCKFYLISFLSFLFAFLYHI